MRKNFEEEREQAQREAQHLTTLLQAHGYDIGKIDWERAGRLASIPVNGVEVGSIISVGGSDERGSLFEDVRYKLLEATAQQLLHETGSANSWSPLELPSNASTEIQSLWRIHLGKDDQPGVNIMEIVRDGKRFYEYYPAGPQFGVHSFPVDTISVQAMRIIKENGGTVTYNPKAQRVDDVMGRRNVSLPEGTQQFGESEELLAPQKFRLPNGAELRLVPNWYTVELDVIVEK